MREWQYEKSAAYKSHALGIYNKSASIAQLVEQGTENPCVAGSIPARGTIFILFCEY